MYREVYKQLDLLQYIVHSHDPSILLQVPLLVSEISDENHPVVVGLADSFYVDTPFIGSGGPGD